jgi:hypothetical protein
VSETISTVTTAEGNTITYQDQANSSEKKSSLITAANGDQTQYEHIYATDAVNKILPCGTELHFEYDYDRQYHYKFVKFSTESTPSSLTKKIEFETIYQDTNSDTHPDLLIQKED